MPERRFSTLNLVFSRAAGPHVAVPAPRRVLIPHSGSPKSVIRATLPTELPIPSVPFTQPRRESARSYRVMLPVPAHISTVRAHRHGSIFRAAQRHPAARSMSLISAIVVSGQSTLRARTKTVSTIAGSGTPGHANGVGAAAQFNGPSGLAVSEDEKTLYVAEKTSHRIRAIDLASATVRDIAGDGTPGSTNGIGTAASLARPNGIFVSGNTLYVTSGDLIRKLEYREVDP